jgi:hypothetical protein
MMSIVKTPSRTYSLGETLPPLGMPVAAWKFTSPNVTAFAQHILNLPLGTIIIDTIDGHPVIAQIQTHTEYGAHPEWTHVPHKGASLFSPAVQDSSGQMLAIVSPPPGWGDEVHIGTEGFSIASIEAIARMEEERARDVVAKVPPMVPTAAGAGIGFLIGNVPGAILGGVIGLGVDLWSHLWKGPEGSVAVKPVVTTVPMASAPMVTTQYHAKAGEPPATAVANAPGAAPSVGKKTA